MFRSKSLFILIIAILFSPSIAQNSFAATPKPGNTCSIAGQLFKTQNGNLTCKKSGKKLFWVPSGGNQSQGSNSQPGSTNRVVEGFLCDEKGPQSAKDARGIELFCTMGMDGKSSWRPKQLGGNSTDSEASSSGVAQVGTNCSNNGTLGFSSGSLVICKNKTVRYALQSDIPAAPSGGYKSRPSWYPTLAKQMGYSEPTCSPSSIKFSSSIIPMDQMAPNIPYGAMIGGHVTPIDHAYLGVKSLNKDPNSRTESDYVPVSSPADGTIVSLQNLGSPTSIRVVINHGCNLFSVYMVLNRLSGALSKYAEELKGGNVNKKVEVQIKAGQEFGRQRDNMLDFNIWDGTSWLSGFANPFSYVSGDAWKPFTADPLPFFTSEIRNALESNMQRTSSPRFGKIDYDVEGTASGNWFLDGTVGYGGHTVAEFTNAKSEVAGGQVNGKNDYSWSHLAIAPQEVDQSKWIFSTGWWKNPAGDPVQYLLNIDSSNPTPDKLTAASGLKVYQLTQFSRNEPSGSPARSGGSTAPYAVGYTVTPGSAQGVVALQVNTDGSLSVEINDSITDPSKFTGFSKDKRIYRH